LINETTFADIPKNISRPFGKKKANPTVVPKLHFLPPRAQPALPSTATSDQAGSSSNGLSSLGSTSQEAGSSSSESLGSTSQQVHSPTTGLRDPATPSTSNSETSAIRLLQAGNNAESRAIRREVRAAKLMFAPGGEGALAAEAEFAGTAAMQARYMNMIKHM